MVFFIGSNIYGRKITKKQTFSPKNAINNIFSAFLDTSIRLILLDLQKANN